MPRIFSLLFLLFAGFALNAQSLQINEFLASNIAKGADEYEEYEDWVEIFNGSAQSIDLAGYYVTDNLNDLTKWQIPGGNPAATVIPAGGYLLLWADDQTFQGATHLPFGLSRSGEDIALVAPDGINVVDAISFSTQHTNISLGRDPGNNANWRFYDVPTPGEANGATNYLGVTSPPLIAFPAGSYNGGFQTEISSTDPQATIRYTLDGHNPEASSFEYQGAIDISGTMALRARAFKDQYIPGEMPSNMYFVDETFTLPVLSVVIDPDDLFDNQFGIYTNYNQEGVEWERPAYNLFLKDGAAAFNIKSGIRIQGRSSRLRPKKSFRLFFKSGYGADRLEYPLFENSSVQSFKNIVLRSGYDDDIQMPTGSLLRDPLTNEHWRGMGELATESNFAILYLNDEYWGIYNLRESVNDHFITDHTGYEDFDLIRYLKQAVDVKAGDLNEFNALYAFIRQNDFSQNAAYQEALQRIDMENFLNLQAMVICAEYRSWLWGVSAYRERTPDSKWRWTIWDMDRTYTNVNWNGFTILNDTTGLEQPNLLVNRLLANQQFKNDYINRIADFLNSRFLPDRVIAKIDSLADHIAPEIPNEASRWSRSVFQWENGVQSLRTFAEGRPAVVRNQLEAYFLVPGWAQLTLNANPQEGQVRINTLQLDSYPWSGQYVQTIPVELEATPMPGFEFVGWSDSNLGNSPVVTVTLDGDKTIDAIFAPTDTTEKIEIVAPLRVRTGERLPIVFRVKTPSGKMSPYYTFESGLQPQVALADTLVKFKKGTATLAPVVNSSDDFILTMNHPDLQALSRNVQVVNSPSVATYNGQLPAGQTVWDASADRLIDGDLTVPNGSELRIEAGTRILLGEHVNIFVDGTLTVEGTKAAPVLFTSDSWSAPWGGIELHNALGNIEYCFFVNGGADPAKGWAHTSTQPLIFAQDFSELNLKNTFILYSPGKALGGLRSTINVDQSVTAFVFHGGEFHYTILDYGNSYVMNIPNDDGVFADDDNDGFHIDYVHPDATGPSRIYNSFFLTGKDDAIDHNRSRLEIINCWLEDWIHEGVAASSWDTVRVINTVALRCEQGFEAGWGSPQMILDHCVSALNDVGLRFGDNYNTPATGQITATNMVIYDNADNIKNFVKNIQGPRPGAIDISFSMTNDVEFDSFPNCITGIPEFDEVYHLLPGSPGRGMGTAGKAMGIIDSLMLTYGPLMVNELMYRPAAGQDSDDWLELYNPNKTPIDIGNWVLKDDDDAHAYTIPAGTKVPANDFWVIARDSLAFQTIHPEVFNIVGNIGFGFGQGDQVRLYATTGEVVDSFAYDAVAPWPTQPNGGGPSLELINRLDNTLPGSWVASAVSGGTPGYQNSLVSIDDDKETSLPERFELAQNFPNPFNPETTIHYSLPKAGIIRLVIYDVLGRKIRTLVNQRQAAGSKQVRWNGRNDQGDIVGSGIYFYRLSSEEFNRVKKMVLLR